MQKSDRATQDMQEVRRRTAGRGFSLSRIGSTGFSIFELALTLAILAMLASATLVPFVSQIAQRRIATTERSLAEAAEALLGYATATGRLPCPATEASNGTERFAAIGNSGNGVCETFFGFLPAATLGFTPIDSQGFAIDGWGTSLNRIRYAVANSTTSSTGVVPTPPNYNFTRTGGMRAARADVMAASKLLYVCSSGANAIAEPPSCGAGAVTLTDSAPVVLWSNGANAATGGASADEAQNPHSNAGPPAPFPAFGNADRVFVSRIATDVPGNVFDDIVTWLSVGNLVSRMVLGGQLP